MTDRTRVTLTYEELNAIGKATFSAAADLAQKPWPEGEFAQERRRAELWAQINANSKVARARDRLLKARDND